MTTQTKLVRSIESRLDIEISPQSTVKFLKQIPPKEIVNSAISVLYLYTRTSKKSKMKNVLMSEVITAIGNVIRNHAKLKKDSAIAAKAGGFILYSFQVLNILQIKLGAGPNGHATYILEVMDDDVLVALWEGLPADKVEKLPSTTPHTPWTEFKHQSGMSLIKTNNKDILSRVTVDTHPILFATVNKAQNVGWRINEDVYPLVSWALRNRADAFSDIWEIHSNEARQSKLREASAITSIAKRFVGKVFYHMYYFDFRGRKYPATAYLHEQGSDLAKGLLLRSDSKRIGRDGFTWLLISIANNWAGDAGREDGYKTDKIPLADRARWAIDNEDIFLAYAEKPKVHQGWMKADKPWQFLAACNELMKFRIWQINHAKAIKDGLLDEYGFSSSIECFIDGSNNGSQHLSALTRDEITAPHVNLVPLALPGDLYKYVADHVWDKLVEDVAALPHEARDACEEIIDTLTAMKNRIAAAPPKSEERQKLVDELLAFKKKHDELIAKAATVFWRRINDSKHKRKVVKRNVMTLPYGGTAYGLG